MRKLATNPSNNDFDKVGNLIGCTSPDRTVPRERTTGRVASYSMHEKITHYAAGNLTERRATNGAAVKYTYNDEKQVTSSRLKILLCNTGTTVRGNFVEQIADGKVTHLFSMPFAHMATNRPIEPNREVANSLNLGVRNLLGSVVDGAATFYLADRIGSICLETDGAQIFPASRLTPFSKPGLAPEKRA